ncbi:hypothetical protein BG52_11565 [Paenibacillus darwinianus]|nr:RNA polymerase factor sigma-54 [Paenibacillus darwinianus]EXX91110.1 hypothetical protein BG52_11565 [Paenibacillus darwinianus]
MYNKLVQTQAQKLTVTANMQQRLHMLQCSNVELADLLQREIGDNPVLEADLERLLPQRDSMRSVGGFDPIAAARRMPDTLERHLLGQLNCLQGIAPDVYEAAKYVIGNLDDNGYLDLDIGRAAADLQLKGRVVEEGLRHVQAMEPAGVGARNLRECLLIQLSQAGCEGELVYRLADGHLEDLAAGRIAAIAKRLNAGLPEIREAARMLKQLSPRPGAGFQKEKPHYVIPDLVIAVEEGGRFSVRMNGRLSQALTINSYYQRIIKTEAVDKGEKRYVEERLASAQSLIKSLCDRERTLLRVTEAIAFAQADFLRCGKGGLVPLSLKDIADRLGMHESTVSRSVTGKYALTPQGLLELKAFFASGIRSSDGAFVAANAIKEAIVR